eukprot:scaffold123448_cov30-Tisochrysis_lutea.AAC.2
MQNGLDFSGAMCEANVRLSTFVPSPLSVPTSPPHATDKTWVAAIDGHAIARHAHRPRQPRPPHTRSGSARCDISVCTFTSRE